MDASWLGLVLFSRLKYIRRRHLLELRPSSNILQRRHNPFLGALLVRLFQNCLCQEPENVNLLDMSSDLFLRFVDIKFYFL